MAKKKKLLIVGDTHANFRFLSYALKKLKPDAAVVVGDFGYWMRDDFPETEGEEGWFMDDLDRHGVRVYFCDGNHENFARLAEIARGKNPTKPMKVRKGIFYMPRGSSVKLCGKRIFFVGGAFSIDREYREHGRTWFDEEILTRKEAEEIAARPGLGKADIVVTHTCPAAALPEVCAVCGINPEWIENSETEESLEMLRPKFTRATDWYFGHWHQAAEFGLEGTGTRFHLLNMTPCAGSLAGIGIGRKKIRRVVRAFAKKLAKEKRAAAEEETGAAA